MLAPYALGAVILVDVVVFAELRRIDPGIKVRVDPENITRTDAGADRALDCRQPPIGFAFPVHRDHHIVMCYPHVAERPGGFLSRFPFAQLGSLERKQRLFQPEDAVVDAAYAAFLARVGVRKEPAQVVDARAIHQGAQKPDIIVLVLLVLVVQGHRDAGARLAPTGLVNDPKRSRLLFPAISPAGELAVRSVEYELLRVIEVSCAAVPADRPLESAVMGVEPIRLLQEVIVGKDAERNAAFAVAFLVTADHCAAVLPGPRIALVFECL